MKNVKLALNRLFAASAPTKPNRRPLSRQDVLALLAANKISAAQAKAIIEKRFAGETAE